MGSISQDNRRKYNRLCFGVCEEGKYVSNGRCSTCEGTSPSPSSPGTGDYRAGTPNYESCNRVNTINENGEPVWFQRHKDGNMRMENMMNLDLSPENWGMGAVASVQITDDRS